MENLRLNGRKTLAPVSHKLAIDRLDIFYGTEVALRQHTGGVEGSGL